MLCYVMLYQPVLRLGNSKFLYGDSIKKKINFIGIRSACIYFLERSNDKSSHRQKKANSI